MQQPSFDLRGQTARTQEGVVPSLLHADLPERVEQKPSDGGIEQVHPVITFDSERHAEESQPPEPQRKGLLKRCVDEFRELFRSGENDPPLTKAVRLGCQTMMCIAAEFAVVTGAMLLTPLTNTAVGNSGADLILDMVRKDPLGALLSAALIAPVLEETICRGIPSGIANFIRKRMNLSTEVPLWPLGVATSVLFALLHGVSAIPLPQFLFGLYLWHVTRKHGLAESILVHSFHNAILLGPMVLSALFST